MRCVPLILFKRLFSNELLLMCVFLLIIVHCSDVEDYVLFYKFGSTNTKVPAQMTIFFFFFFFSSFLPPFFLLLRSIDDDRILFFLIGYLNYLDQVILYSFNFPCSDAADVRLINKRENAIVFKHSFVSHRFLAVLQTHLLCPSNHTVKKKFLFIFPTNRQLFIDWSSVN